MGPVVTTMYFCVLSKYFSAVIYWVSFSQSFIYVDAIRVFTKTKNQIKRKGKKNHKKVEIFRTAPWPGLVGRPSQSHTERNERDNHGFLTLLDSFEFNKMIRTYMFLCCGKKLTHLKKAQSGTERTCKGHTERSRLGLEPRT